MVYKPSLKNKTFTLSLFRVVIVWLVVLLSMAFLLTRLLWIQVLHPENLIKEGNSRVVRNYSFEPARGLITDRFGRILAISVPVKTVYADALELSRNKVTYDVEKIKKVAAILELSPQEVFSKIKNPKRRHVRLKQYLTLDKAKELSDMRLPGIIINDNYQRYYPTGAVNAHLVGLLNSEGDGVYGVEQSFNSYLSAKALSRVAHKDLQGHIIENVATLEEGKAGGNLMLSVDDRLQTIAYSSLQKAVTDHAAESGSAVMIDVKTGEVLAMVNYPSFDPNDRSVFNSEKAKNRSITDILEPGSTAKPIVALGALEQNTVSWKEIIDTRPFVVDGKLIRDSHAMNYGTLTEILKYSSNTGMAHIALRTGPTKILDTLKQFGLGHSTESGLVGEVNGTLNANRRFWSEIDKATIGFGYGIAVTPLQLSSAYATLANYGSRLPVSILRLHQKPTALQVADVSEVKRIHAALETVVSQGTGGKAAIDRYRIAGKTGTAKIAEAGGYGSRYFASFAGFAPISNPRFALVVVIRAPQKGSFYGGTVSGPVFRDVMTRALQLYNIAPDKPDK